MITVEFLGPIGKKPLTLDISNLSQLSEIKSLCFLLFVVDDYK